MQTAPSVTFDHGIFVTQRFGGVSRYFVELARHLRQAGLSVAVQSPLYVTDALRSLGPDARGCHVPVFPGVTRLGTWLAQARMRDLGKGLVHETWYGETASRRQGPIAITLHDMISELFPGEVRGGADQSRRKRAAVDRADVILCVSDTTRKDAMDLFDIPASRLVVTPLASSLPVLPRVVTGKPCVLYVGHRGGYKNFALLLRTFASHVRIRRDFQLICFGGPAFDAGERRRADAAGDVVHIAGNDALLASLYARAHVLVCTSRYEGFGLPLLEAMSAGCPVVAVRGGSTPEVGGLAVTYVRDDDADELGGVLETLLYDEASLATASERGLARSRAFSWERTAAITADAYGPMLNL